MSEKIAWYGGNLHTVGDQKWTSVCKGDRGGRLTDGKENGGNWVFLCSRNPLRLFFPSSHTSIPVAIFSSYLLLEYNLNVFFLVFPLLLRSLPWLSSVFNDKSFHILESIFILSLHFYSFNHQNTLTDHHNKKQTVLVRMQRNFLVHLVAKTINQ